MDDFGLITIDNKNLLNDLLELDGKHDFDDQLDLLYGTRAANIGQQPQSNRQYNNTTGYLANKSPYLQQQTQLPTQGKKFYVESPTFAKGEDDIYRFVHSRISVIDHEKDHENLKDSLDNNIDLANYNKKNTSNKDVTTKQQRIGSNKLLSDLAVASLSKQQQPRQPSKTFNKPPAFDEHPYDTNHLVDSLDANVDTSNGNNTSNLANQYYQQQPLYNSDNQQQQQQQQLRLQNSSNNNIIQPFQLISQPSPIQQLQTGPFQPVALQTFTAAPPPNIQPAAQPLFVLPSPNSSYQFQPQPQFIPVIQPQQPNMFYQEPIQPMFYNTAYPINLGNGGPLMNSNSNPYYSQQQQQQNDYMMMNDPYQQQQQQQYQQYQQQQQQQYQQQQMYNNNNGVQSGSKYNAQPLQPPAVAARNQNNNNNNYQNNQSRNNNENYDQDADYPDENEDNDLNNDFGSLRVNNQNGNDENDDDMKRQQVWNKLRKARQEVNEKHNSGQLKKTMSNNNLQPIQNSKGASGKKNQQVMFNQYTKGGRNEGSSNHLERNIEAIKNKENLTHRYPEKKYELVHGKNLASRFQKANESKKPPHHLQPLDNYDDDDDEADYSNQKTITLNLKNPNDPYDQSKKITIPIEAGKLKNALKDKDNNSSINLDINLRLVDFMANNNGNNPRSLDDFDVYNDPLNRNYRNYETNISRSLPGSSGSLNKLNKLPPLNNKRGGGIAPYSHNDNRLQHEYDNEYRYEEGYLAQLQKSHVKPVIKTYTIKDYRNFKKDAIPTSTNSTGKLGFDYSNEQYKQKLEVSQRKGDYADRVKARNRMLLEQQRKEENDSKTNNTEPSKTQRAKDYVKAAGVIRPRSAQRNDDASNYTPTNERQAQKITPPSEKRVPVKFSNGNNNNRASPTVVSHPPPIPKKTSATNNQKARVDLNKTKEETPSDTTIVRIRDPITSKVKKIYLNDKDIEMLSHRHEEDKQKVNNVINKTNSMNANSFRKEEPVHTMNHFNFNKNSNMNDVNANANKRKPVDLESPPMNLNYYTNANKKTTDDYNARNEADRNITPAENDNNRSFRANKFLDVSMNQNKEHQPAVAFKTSDNKIDKKISFQRNNSNGPDDNDDQDFEKLLQRHNQEKNIVNGFNDLVAEE